jgi:hypothetical protein
VLGVTIGVVAALALTRLMSRLLFGASVADPLTFTAVAAPIVRSSSRMLHPSPPRHARRPPKWPCATSNPPPFVRIAGGTATMRGSFRLGRLKGARAMLSTPCKK